MRNICQSQFPWASRNLSRHIDEFFAVQVAVERGIVDAQAVPASVFFADAAFSEAFELAEAFSFMDIHNDFSVLSLGG